MEVDGIYIILENVGGPIDSHFVPVLEGEEPELEVELVRAIQDNHWIFNEGDTIKFREGRQGLTLDQLRSHLYA
jgi:hypothetical protein